MGCIQYSVADRCQAGVAPGTPRRGVGSGKPSKGFPEPLKRYIQDISWGMSTPVGNGWYARSFFITTGWTTWKSGTM